MSSRHSWQTIAAATAILLVPLGGPARAQPAQSSDYANCQQGDDLARSIAACTRVAGDPAQSPADRALAWRFLGNDRLAGNGLEDAISAFGEAIRLDPRNAAIYASRAIASQRKGDTAAAIFDYRKAVGLDAVKIGGMADASTELKEIAGAAASAPQIGPVLTAVREGSKIRCGVSPGVPGFSAPDFEGRWTGIDADFCRALAAAIFSDPNKVDFIPLDSKDRFVALQNGEIDVLARNSAKSAEREREFGIKFGATNFYGGTGFMVRRSLKVSSAGELDGAVVCVVANSIEEKQLADYMHDHNLKYDEKSANTLREALAVDSAGRCDALFADVVALFVGRHGLAMPSDYIILPDIITSEELAPSVRQGDEQWLRIVTWTHYAMVAAAQIGLSQATVDSLRHSTDPAIQRFLGSAGPYGKVTGLNADWTYSVIKSVGNYQEIYQRNLVQPLQFEWRANALVRDGGNQQAPTD
jgi:general L-amino acid transport system substrate-binding protein